MRGLAQGYVEAGENVQTEVADDPRNQTQGVRCLASTCLMSPANRKSGSQYLIGSAKHELLHTFNIHRELNTPECHRMKRNYYFTFGNNKESSLGFIGIWNLGD